MGKLGVQRMQADYQQMPNVQKKKDSNEVTEDFKKLLKDKPEAEKEEVKESSQGKEEAVQTEKPEQKEVNETLLSVQMSHLLCNNCVPVQTEKAETAVQADTVAEAVERLSTAENGEQMILSVAEQQVQNKSESEGKQLDVENVQTEGHEVLPQEEQVSRPAAEKLHSENEQKSESIRENKHISRENAEVPEAQADTVPMSVVKPEQEIKEPIFSSEHRQVYRTAEAMRVERPEEIPQKLSEQLLIKTAEGVNEFEIQVEPEHLGKIAIKVVYEQGQTTVLIACSEKKTQELLGQHARELGNVMERNLGEETTVYVEKETTDYLNQNDRENEQARRESEQQRQREESRKQKSEDAARFLQKLRLGLNG